jgi:signal transduction histidine kinase
MSSNKTLVLTLIAIAVIAVYVTLNSYYTQVKIYEEKELFKLDCIANAVAFKISGDEHDALVRTYPDSVYKDSVTSDERFRKIHEQMSMAQMMTKVPSSMQTIVNDPEKSKYFFAVTTEPDLWMDEARNVPDAVDTMYAKGGMIGRYQTDEGVMLGALSPLMNEKGEVVGSLHVEETFDSFLSKAKDQIYFNLLISVVFILIIGSLMFFSVRALLIRQHKLALERLAVENMRKELLANVSHDLRTPLASIHGYVETLLLKNDALDEPTRKQYLETTLKGTERLNRMVDELFELSRLESKERKLQPEIFSLKELAFDVVAHLEGQATQKKIAVITEFPDRDIRVNAELALIDRVLQNLISNAIRYCHEGSTVHVWLNVSGNQVTCEVADNGPGIPEEEIPYLFDRFHRGTHARSGSGLGLAIVRRALELHGTSCEVKSAAGRGTAFRFSLTIAS